MINFFINDEYEYGIGVFLILSQPPQTSKKPDNCVSKNNISVSEFFFFLSWYSFLVNRKINSAGG
jgi:hypothetical protein